MTYEAGVSGPLRRRFSAHPKLANTYDTGFREVMNEEPVFSFSKHFALGGGKYGSKTGSVLYTVALIQDPVTQFAAAPGPLVQMKPLWKSYHANDTDMINFHYFDYSIAASIGREYADNVIAHAKATVSDTYADIVSISARQVMGATVFSGTPEEPILFLKEISSNGNFQTVDVIFPGYTFFLYTNPKWLAYLIEPLLKHQQAGLYPNKYYPPLHFLDISSSIHIINAKIGEGIQCTILGLTSLMQLVTPMGTTRQCRSKNVEICWLWVCPMRGP